MKKYIIAFIIFFSPTKLSYWLLNLLGCQIHKSAKIGFSLLLVDELKLGKNARIGHLNLLLIKKLDLSERAYINRANVIKGGIELELAFRGSIGNSNVITRAPKGVSYGIGKLHLGELSKITANHRVDCMRDIIIGDYSTIAGSGSQLWTHGYYHEPEGPGRFRIDGSIVIGNNVYIGSACVFNPGVKVGDKVTVGSCSCISKDLLEPGLYVSQPLRFIDANAETVRAKLDKVEDDTVVEEVYTKD